MTIKKQKRVSLVPIEVEIFFIFSFKIKRLKRIAGLMPVKTLNISAPKLCLKKNLKS